MKYIKSLTVSILLFCSLGAVAEEPMTTYARSGMNTTLALKWTSNNYGTIKWQTSDDGTTWTDIMDANATTYTFQPQKDTWIRAVVNGDKACQPIIKTYLVKTANFSVACTETTATTATFKISYLNIPKSEITEWGFCHNYNGLSRTYSNMYSQKGGTTLPDDKTFELTCHQLQPNQKHAVRVYFKTRGGSTIYGPSKIVTTQPGIEWSSENWEIDKTSVTMRFRISGYDGYIPTMKLLFGTKENMKSYTPVSEGNGLWSVKIEGLQPATSYETQLTADVDGDKQTITKTVRTWTDYSTYKVDQTVKPVSHKIIWNRENRIQLSPDNIQAEYPRLQRVSADSILLVYHGGDGTAVNTDHWQDIYLQRSTDNGVTWSKPEKLMDHAKRMSNDNYGWNRFSDPTFTRLTNGWILMQFIGNANPETNNNCQVFVCISKDGGNTWGDPITVGRGRTWEPQIVQLPGGELELLVSSEAYWWDHQRDNLFQEILCSRSTDNGETWTSFKRASYNPSKRDGMPVPVVMQGNKGILFSIESINSNENPSLVWRALDSEWDANDWDGQYDANRWVAEPIRGGCAPFAMQISTGEIVVMGHLGQSGSTWQTNRSQVCIGDNTGHNFKYRTLPFSTLPYGEGAY